MRLIIFWGFILISAVIILGKPFWGIVLYSAMNIIRPEMFFWGGSSGGKSLIVIFGATALGIIINLSKHRLKPLFRAEILFIVWLYAGLLVSIFFSQYEAPSAYYYANEILKLALLCAFLLILINTPEKLLKYENMMLLSIVLLSVWGIEQHFRANERLEGLGGHAFGDSNVVAATFVLFFPLAFHKIFNSDEIKTRAIGFFSAMVIVLLIVFTKSRGGFLALIACTAIMFLRSGHKSKLLIFGVLISAIVLPFIGEDYISRVSTMKNEESLDTSAKSRLILWQAGIMVFRDNPILGTGFQTYPLAKMRYRQAFDDLTPEFKEWVFRTEKPKVTHNTYIQVLSDGGVVAATPYFLLVIWMLIKNRAVRKKYPLTGRNKDTFMLLTAVEAGIIGFCVAIIFIDAITAVFLPVQIVICSIARDYVMKESADTVEAAVQAN